MFKKSSILFAFILILFAFISPASADYIGPDRDVTTYEVEEIDYGVWAKTYDGTCNPTHNPPACIVCEWEGSPGNACGDAEYSYKLGTRYDTVAVTTTYPPATITGQIQNCILQNGWCVTISQIELNANEPLAGHEILLIEGIRNSEIFACGEFETTCQIPLLEGINTLEYWAISSWGDSSRKGTTTVKVDTVAPNLNLLVNGTLGLNSWYVSNTTITAEGADDTSGIYEKVLSIDNGNTWIPSTTLSDGVYTVDIRITDNAYNVSTASTIIQVDTTTPNLSLSVSGTKGNNNYYVSKPKITVNANDITSGIAKIEMTADGGPWTVITAPVEFGDGIHTYQFRVYDHAGNMTESSVQQIKVDTTPPSIDLTQKLDLGDVFEYGLQDTESGLAVVRVVIEDEDERFPKVVWLENLSSNTFEDSFIWDGKWKDKSTAIAGEYPIFIKATDQAGNEAIDYGLVKVSPLSYFQSIPEFIPPVSEETSNEPTSQLDNEETTEQSFGGINNPPTQTNNPQTLISLTGTATAGASTNTTSTSNILWGAGAMAVIGAATAYALEQQRQREEEEEQSYQQAQQQAEMLNQQEQQRIINQWLEGQAILNAHIEQLESQGATPEQIAELREQGATSGFGTAIGTSVVLGEYLAQQQALAELQAQQNALAYQTYRDGEYVSVPIVEDNPFLGATASSGLGTSSSSGGFFSNITTPSNSSGALFNFPNSPIVSNLIGFASIIDHTIFNGYLTQTYFQGVQSANNLTNTLQASPIYNAIDNVLSFGAGAALQYMNDMSFGLVDRFVNFENGSDAFQSGMELGRTISDIQGYLEIVVGGALFLKGAVELAGSFIASLGCSTLGGPPGGAACAVLSTPIVIVGTSEMIAGGILAGHGGLLVGNNANNPLQIRGNGGGGGNSAYNTAKSGGKHSGTYILYRLKPTKQIQSALNSYENVIQEHYDKIANPEQWIDNWDKLPDWKKEKIIQKWQYDIARNQDLADIMRGILQERGIEP